MQQNFIYDANNYRVQKKSLYRRLSRYLLLPKYRSKIITYNYLTKLIAVNSQLFKLSHEDWNQVFRGNQNNIDLSRKLRYSVGETIQRMEDESPERLLGKHILDENRYLPDNKWMIILCHYLDPNNQYGWLRGRQEAFRNNQQDGPEIQIDPA